MILTKTIYNVKTMINAKQWKMILKWLNDVIKWDGKYGLLYLYITLSDKIHLIQFITSYENSWLFIWYLEVFFKIFKIK